MTKWLSCDYYYGWQLDDWNRGGARQVEVDLSFLARMDAHLKEGILLQEELRKLYETFGPTRCAG